ncbi:hypothetical protein AAC387_Pa02g4446 [Persea americana]
MREFSSLPYLGEDEEEEYDCDSEIIKPTDGYRSIGIQNLPKDIVMDILSRLCVHSLLLECMLVSRERQDIIVNNPIFATLQHNRALENQSSNLSLMFYRKNSQGVNLYFIEREDVGRRKLRVMDAMLTKPTGFKGRPRILGSCNGLICISSNEIGRPAYMTNPNTGEFVILPTEERKNARIVEMGFDSVKKEFKVVRMPLIEDDDTMKAEIYTLGTNAWRQMGNFTQRSNKFSNVLVNGSLHWCKWKAPLFITSLDMSDEQFGMVPSPKFTDTRSSVHLMAWNGLLWSYAGGVVQSLQLDIVVAVVLCLGVSLNYAKLGYSAGCLDLCGLLFGGSFSSC